MQILGIYLNSGDPQVIKNLKTEEKHGSEKCWYPFGNIENCHNLFNDNPDTNRYSQFSKKLSEQQDFNNFLFNIEKGPKININCIVGKNGSGKSSLLALEYRIINNLACKIQQYLRNNNQDFEPVWATGFNAELYYLIDDSLFQIKVKDNVDFKIINKTDTPKYIEKLSLKVIKLKADEETKENDVSPKEINLNEEDNVLLDKIANKLFYTVGTNYSIYSNSQATDKWGKNEEKWMNTIFHKNDGYFTPIVLVPYKYDNCATIDTRKELNLAKERVTTLSLLVYIESKSNFVENQKPVKYCYQLISSDDYKTTEKLIRTIRNTDDEDNVNFKDLFNSASITQIHNNIKSKWEEILFTEKKENEYKSKISSKDKDEIWKHIKENTLDYLAYKLLKMCMFYDEYANLFLGDNDKFVKDMPLKYKVLQKIESEETSCMLKFQDLMHQLIDRETKINFINLKVKQCIEFLDNLEFYIGSKQLRTLFSDTNEIPIDIATKNSKTETLNTFLNRKLSKTGLNYDNVFINLLPPYFNKELYYEGDKTLASLSSGESQLMNSLSYAVYHIKNASSSNKIGYKYVNLVFDEAELYYHPEYQRTFIQKLLGVIERSNLSDLISINITIVTHSPFIISDIPHTNLLCLKEGERVKDVISKTLGANFYDLMQNQFFMESTIGAVSENMINTIIKDFYDFINLEPTKKEEKESIQKKYLPKSTENQKSNETIETNDNNDSKPENYYITFINNLADDYLRKTFQNMVATILGEDYYERREKELETKIEELKKLKESEKS